MEGFQRLAILCTVLLRSLVQGSLHQDYSNSKLHSSIENNNDRINNEIKFAMEVHGLLLWASMGFLMPLGILVIRMSSREEGGSTKLKLFFYLHLLLQILAVSLVTAGGVMSVKKFENLFNNGHQRIGLALYIAVWVQTLVGLFRPHRGKKERRIWYLIHWIVGTTISLVGIINVYTGLNAYHKKTAKPISLWTLLFTVQLSLTAFFYLFQDKWHYFQKQYPLILDHSKQNSLRNLFNRR